MTTSELSARGNQPALNAFYMNPTTTDPSNDDILGPDDIQVEGKVWVRAKRRDDVPKGYRVKVHREDGTILEREVQIPSYMITLDPDVREYFPDGESVNATLRSLIALIPKP